MKQAQFKDYLHLHFLVIIWGFTAILGLLISVSPLSLTFYRTLLSAFGLGLILFFSNKKVYIPRRERLKMILIGCSMGVHWFAFFASARASNASVCLAGMATTSLWTALLAPLVGRRRISTLEVGLGLIVILGLYVIFRFELDRALGLTLAIASAFLAAVFTIANSYITNKYDATVITFYEMIGGCISTGLLWLGYSLLNPAIQNPLPSLHDWLWIAVLAWICTVYAYSAGVHLLRKISPFTFNLTVNLEPVYGIVLAYLIFGDSEKMTTGFYLGTLLILVAVISYPIINSRIRAKK